MDIKEIEETFMKFIANNYDLEDEYIKMRLAHSFRVEKACELIAESEGFPKEDQVVASLAGLLHDYGRFYQWREYKTTNDVKSVDHGDLAIKLLFDNNEIANYTSEIRNYDEIFDAIKYHNKYENPENLSEHNQTILKIVKDADKMDILYLWSRNEVEVEDFGEDYPLNEEMVEDFLSGKLVKYRKNMNKNDHVLCYLGYLYDINYNSSLEYIKENELLDKIYNQLIDKKKFKKYFDIAGEYINKRLGD